MKRLIFLLIPIVLMTIIVFGVIQLFILQDKNNGAIQVTSHPTSKVYIDGKYLGNTPLCRCEGKNMIHNGEYNLRLVPIDSNLQEFQERVSINKGVLTVVDETFGKGASSEGSTISLLQLSDKQAIELLVVSFPDKAQVFIDENLQGNTPLHVTDTTDSDHTIRLKREGYKDKNVRIRTPVGYKLTATIYLGLPSEENTGIVPAPTALAQPSATPSATLSPANKSGKVVILQTPNGFLRVRQEPSLTASEIARVSTGLTFDLLDETTGWYKIRLESGLIGWISADYTKKQ